MRPALAWVMFAILLVLTVLQLRITHRRSWERPVGWADRVPPAVRGLALYAGLRWDRLVRAALPIIWALSGS